MATVFDTYSDLSKIPPPTLMDLRSVLDKSQDLHFFFNSSLKCIFINTAAKSFCEIAEESEEALTLDKLGPLGGLMEISLSKVLSTGSPQIAELQFQTPSGIRACFEAVYYASSEPQEAKRIGVTMRNVTARKQRERGLFEIQESYQAERKALSVFDIIAETDRRGRITFVNDRFVEISKYSRNELIGKDHRILNSGIHPKSFFQELWDCIIQGETWSGEICNRAKDGSLYWVSTVITPVFDSRGQFKKFLSIRREITKQKQAEEALRESELRYRRLLDSIKLLAVGLNLQGQVTFGSASLLKLLGKTSQEIIGLHWNSSFIPDCKKEEMSEIFSSTITGNSLREYECELLNSFGEKRLIAWTNTVFRNTDGNILGITAIGEDITEKRHAENRLLELREKIERQKEEIIAVVSHELRSPLMAIRASADMLTDRLDGSPLHNDGAKDLLKRIRGEVARIDRISKDLIEGCIHRSGELKFEIRPTHLHRLLKRVCCRLREDTKVKPKLKLKLQAVESEIIGQWDPSRLDQVFSNLIGNAIKYSKEEGGEIRVSAQLENQDAHIIIRDNGVGIPKENLESIFELFSRAENVLCLKTTGFGLGLKIARDIVHKHRGKIWAESELGKGSSFHVLLPLNGALLPERNSNLNS